MAQTPHSSIAPAGSPETGPQETVSDWQLLARFTTAADQGAFAALVRRHIDMVHRAAKRMLGGAAGSVGEAEDVTQAVFLLLAQKAAKLVRSARDRNRNGTLAGWLYSTTRYCCANVKKTRARRRRHEREAAMTPAATEAHSSDLNALLDEGLAILGDKERQAILLRYLEQHSAAEAATTLAISGDALEKRLERGLAKLRRFFARRGHAVPALAVASILAAEGTHSAPAMLVPATLAAGKAAPAAIVTLAKGASHMMVMHSVKMTAAAALVAIATAGAVGGAVTLASAARQNPPPPVAATGGGPADVALPAAVGRRRTRLFRYDLVLTGPGAERVRAAAATPVKTDSVGYDAYLADSEQLRQALLGAESAGEVEIYAPFIGSAQQNSMPRTELADPFLASNRVFASAKLIPGEATGITPQQQERVLVDSGQITGVTVDARGPSIRLAIADTLHPAGVGQPGKNGIDARQMRIAFAGDIPVQEATVFLGELGKNGNQAFVHASVWEVFSCSDAEYNLLPAHGGVRPWIGASVAQHLVAADRTILWRGQAYEAATKNAPEWTRVLAQGCSVRLIGVADENRWPNCWWDPAGQPVVTNQGYAYVFSLEYEQNGYPKPPGQEKGGQLSLAFLSEDQAVTRFSGENAEMRNSPARNWVLTLTTVQAGQPVEVGMGVGPWKEAGTIPVGGKLEFDGMQVELVSVQAELGRTGARPGSSSIRAKGMHRLDREVEVFAVDKAGTLSASLGAEIVLKDKYRSRDDSEDTQSVEMAKEDTDHYIVRWRPREWTRFEGYAAAPKVVPDALMAQAARAIEPPPPATGTQPAVSLTPPAASTQPAKDSPEGFMTALAAAAHTHNVANVRAMMVAHGKVEESWADTMAEELTSSAVLRDALLTRFKPEEVEDAFGGPGLIMQIPATLPTGLAWKVEGAGRGDRATMVSSSPNVQVVGGPGGSLVRVDGQWKMDVTFHSALTPEQQAEFEKQLSLAKQRGAARRAFAGQLEKYKDIYEARDAFRTLMQAGAQ